jgi:hypothetical protein
MEGIMPAPNYAIQPAQPLETTQIRDPRSRVALLAALHEEAEETARLANLLGRSIHVAIALPALAGVTLAFGNAGPAEAVAWTCFVLAASITIGLVYRRTIGQPFERAALQSFSQDLSAVLVFAGTAWGAGAFLALPADAGVGLVLAFAVGAASAIAVLLRERMSVFLFLAPATMLTSFACLLRPLAGGALDAALVLIASAAVAAAAHFAQTMTASERNMTELAGLPRA